MVTRWRHTIRLGVRHCVSRHGIQRWQPLGTPRRVSLSLWHVRIIYGIHSIPCTPQAFKVERTVAQMGPRCHLLAHSRQLLPSYTYCATQPSYWGWSLFTFVWLCAIVGTAISFIKLKEHSNLETFCFVGMGLSVLVAFKPLIDSVSTAAVAWIIAEGVAYITGAVFYSLNKKRYMHSVFHFFVLAGSICHIIAVWDVLMEYL